MIKINCYELRTPTVGDDYFNGGYGSARVWEVEHFLTEAEALEALEVKKAIIRKRMEGHWWFEKYGKDEDFTVKAVEVVV